MSWSKEQIEIIRRNQAIAARNRCMLENCTYLGLSTEPMELEPMPVDANDSEERTW